MDETHWIRWIQSLQTIAQAGLTYSQNPFDRERYHQLLEIASEMLVEGVQVDAEVAVALVTSESGYATPKLDVRGAVFHGDDILLVKENSDGGWTLPGGWVDLNESPRRAAEREVYEESGYRVQAEKLLGIYDRNLHGYPPTLFHSYKLVIQCQLIGGEAATSLETGGAEFFAEDRLPHLSLARITPQLLARIFEHHRNPNLPADLD